MTDIMADTSMKILYGDYTRNDEDPTSWMQNLNTRKVANNWTDVKIISVFEALLAEDKKVYWWWHEDLKITEPSMDRTDWATVQKEFKKRWPPLPEPEDDPEAKREELEQMRLRDEDIRAKVTSQGQELYSHVAFMNQAACLANEIGDTNGFLLPSVRSQLPEAVRNTLKNSGRKAKTGEEFRKAMTTMPLSDLHEEAADIAKRDSFYTEVAALQTRTTGLTPNMARTVLQSHAIPTPTSNRTPTPQTVPPSTPPPRYANQTPGPRTPMQNKPMPDDSHQASPTNPFRPTPSTN